MKMKIDGIEVECTVAEYRELRQSLLSTGTTGTTEETTSRTDALRTKRIRTRQVWTAAQVATLRAQISLFCSELELQQEQKPVFERITREINRLHPEARRSLDAVRNKAYKCEFWVPEKLGTRRNGRFIPHKTKRRAVSSCLTWMPEHEEFLKHHAPVLLRRFGAVKTAMRRLEAMMLEQHPNSPRTAEAIETRCRKLGLLNPNPARSAHMAGVRAGKRGSDLVPMR